MNDPKGTRQDIAAKLLAAMPEGYASFASPPDVPSVPCVFLDTRPPYRELLTTTEEVMRLRVGIVAQAAMGSDALDWFDDVFDRVKAGLDAATASIDWNEADLDGIDEANGIQYALAHVDITVY